MSLSKRKKMKISEQIKLQIVKALEECGVDTWYEPLLLIQITNDDVRTAKFTTLLLDDRSINVISQKINMDTFKEKLKEKGIVVEKLSGCCRPLE